MIGLSDERIARVVRDEANAPQMACERLVQEVNDLGGKDNITVIVARFQEGDVGGKNSSGHK